MTPSCILLGSKPGSVVALSVLLERGWDVRHVVVGSSVAHPWVAGRTLEEAATAAGIGVVPQSGLPAGEAVDFVISYMYRYKVKAPALAMARRAAVNFHAAPLPEYAGWAFYNFAILEDAADYGCSCHHMDEGFDSGPLVEVRHFPIDASAETAYTLERRAQREMIRLFVDFCRLAESGAELPRIPQDPARMRYVTQEQFEAAKRIPADADPETVDRIARAFWYPPYGCAYVEVGEGRAEVVPEAAKQPLAELLHADDLAEIAAAARAHLAADVT